MDDRTVAGRILAVLDAVAVLHEAATLAGVTRHTGLPKPTVRRIVADLVTRGVLNRRGDFFQLGPRLLELGLAAADQQGLREASVPHAQDLLVRSGEIAWVLAFTPTANAVLHNAFAANRAVDMRQPWPISVGNASFLASAVGRILLASRPDLLDRLRRRSMPRLTPYTLTEWPKIRQAVQTVQDNGISIEHEQSLRGYACVAAGVRSPDRLLIGAIGVTGRTGQFQPERYARRVLHAANSIEQALRR